MAQCDANRCCGYFPALAGQQGIESDLPCSRQFGSALPKVEMEGMHLSFNFLRISLLQQQGDFPFHLDSDVATALTGDISTLNQRAVWRLLLNLNASHPRQFAYLDLQADASELRFGQGYVHYALAEIPSGALQTIRLLPRSGSIIHGVLFCANRVLHTGQDDENGHFVAAYGCEMPI